VVVLLVMKFLKTELPSKKLFGKSRWLNNSVSRSTMAKNSVKTSL